MSRTAPAAATAAVLAVTAVAPSTAAVPQDDPAAHAPLTGGQAAARRDGTGTRIAVLDTGADAEHPDLKGRITAHSYDGGATWTEARAGERGGRWSAPVDHAGAAGKPVTLRTRLTDADGSSVTHTVIRAYDVR
ncbi:hypothetical protein [Streptomyces sp. SP18CS02]|uniref:hypothetical protein n=1 Tax=Streptomyces sp. SP18CS02 TaxID=3002531 RepID=UPI002E783B7F|nr:hypothetical protein [Streptomyces sp. SP18CS02]MEE1756596.1 hypothetical protein [Streptomyces sp. SP18CS02]